MWGEISMEEFVMGEENLQYIPANPSNLKLSQLTLKSELGDHLAITKGFETTHKQIHHYNMKRFQCVPANTSNLKLYQLTLGSELDNHLAITKDLALIICHFDPFNNEVANRKIHLFFLTLISMLLLLDDHNWVTELTITKMFRQYWAKVLAVALLSCFTVDYLMLKIYCSGCRRFCILYSTQLEGSD